MAPGLKVLGPVNSREQEAEQQQGEVDGAASLEIEKTPERHETDENSAGAPLADEMGGQLGNPSGRKRKLRPDQGENSETDRKAAKDAVHSPGHGFH
jgi:hypothetical protein